ncbi:MAG: T9SS type A sorting domain-containing protein [Bacteroidota bacterium]
MKLFLIISVAVLFSFNLFSATYTVTNTNDSGAGSLRQAITDANAIGPDIIAFNILNTDPGYNVSAGVWIISPLTELPYFTTGYTTIDGSTQTANQGNTNPYGPEIVIDGTNSIIQCFILPSPNNQVKNLVIGNFSYGINLYGSPSNQNIITGCYLGVGYDGSTPFPNDISITVSNGSYNNDITFNLISGNHTAGIGIQTGNGNEISGNMIGTNYLGTDTVPNPIGILIDNSTNNAIGGNSFSKRNIISGNSDDGILINSNINSNNIITGNFIGTDITGLNKLPNAFGIILANSGNNTIGGVTAAERNIISGNLESGILINGTGAEENLLINNYIGVDSTGLNILDNHVGVLVKTNADKNIIGGTSADKRNVISGNSEIGVYIESCDSNVVIGNYFGPDATGLNSLKVGDTLFQANGIELNTVAKYNRIGGYNANERNIISGNRVYGMIYYGQTSENYLIGNYIGTDVTGNVAMPNATGICVDASSNHNYIFENVLSGNISYGIFIVTNGSYYNQVKRNMIGTNAAGTDTVPNDIGLLFGGGARYNIVGGSSFADANVISGNRYNGIEIADNLTDYNEISFNYIGTDGTGNVAVPNGNGIGFSANPSHNIVDNNIISGNNLTGIILYEYADSNIVTNNLIGTATDGVTDLGNTLAGVVIATGACYNVVGGAGNGNTIAFNGNGGIVIMDAATVGNTISANSIFQNEVLGGIDILPYGININDAGDTDTGPNEMMNFPVINSSVYDPNLTYAVVSGTLDTQSPENCVVEVFISDPNAMFNGDGIIYLGNTTPDISGNWTFATTNLTDGEEVTSTATDSSGNTSEFSANFSTIVGKAEIGFSENFRIYPNPAGDYFIIEPMNEDEKYCFELTDYAGQFLTGKETSGIFVIDISGYSSGIYLLKISDQQKVSIKKIVK